jgi:hypothetical protein
MGKQIAKAVSDDAMKNYSLCKRSSLLCSHSWGEQQASSSNEQIQV